MPLYALERSTEDIAFEPPNAKNVIFCESKDVMVTSIALIFRESRIIACSRNIKKIGILTAFDCVIKKRVRLS
jgi:hypothetical protein